MPRELFGVFLLFLGIITLLSLITFDLSDRHLNHVVNLKEPIKNGAGIFGAYLAGLIVDFMGIASYFIPIILFYGGYKNIWDKEPTQVGRKIGLIIFWLCFMSLSAIFTWSIGDIKGGGLIGISIGRFVVFMFSSIGAFIVFGFFILLSAQLIFKFSWLVFLNAGLLGFINKLTEKKNSFVDFLTKRFIRKSRQQGETYHETRKDEAKRYASTQHDIENTSDVFNKREELKVQHQKHWVDASELSEFNETTQQNNTSQDNTTQNDTTQPILNINNETKPSESSHVSLIERPSFTDKPQVKENKSEENTTNIAAFQAQETFMQQETNKKATQPQTFIDEDIPEDLAWLSQPSPLQTQREPNQYSNLFDEQPEKNVSIETAIKQDKVELVSNIDGNEPIESFVNEPLQNLPKDVSSEPFKQVTTSLETQNNQARAENKAPDLIMELNKLSIAKQINSINEPSFEQKNSLQAKPQNIVTIQDDAEEDYATEDFIEQDVNLYQEELPKTSQSSTATVATHKKEIAITTLPSFELLEEPNHYDSGPADDILDEKARSLMACLSDFGIQGELMRIVPGPVVTMFEVKPAPGVRVAKISNLNDDIALALKAVAVRVQAPIPGSDTVGIEIPNEIRETVYFKDILDSESYKNSESILTMALGKDIAGIPIAADLAKMPHLLVAGATGAGKSVCLNSILLSFLYKAKPHELKLLLVDPKRIELAVYADLPHLVHPVVTEMSLAKNALEWAVAEMDKRYTDIARLGVRNITAFNAKLKELGKNRPPELCDLEPMPYLVVIIDELADLMLTGAKEVETSIVRLAQLARAAGIHLILATQRPSVDVVTGLIKANFPCRISFQVTSKHDSRTILDAVGAEHLLGKGDMLFKPSGGKFQRLHGAFVGDDEVVRVADFWRSQMKPDYKVDFAALSDPSSLESGSTNLIDNIGSDPMYKEAVSFVYQQGKASISLIQRRFRIGFNRAARYVEQMEHDGIIGPADGSKPRVVIR
ncbi:DNA translocase FtsK [Desulfovibrio litoralis]|uniref:Ftsk gamma domain-containing protein n=1 Tax=Desulfovibrio litoralis DSM 11393 TaxID=1121455 RepID=A0A1M7SY77_9BACT|nr:DNA translocase FtsK [Desulfovibrio litoralis]SHN63348.1 Ftsk gamma domain-containing protein [Desulfovibrio litoralis DSM 11393]